MTCQEFSDEFDVLYNNIMSNQAPGLDEYEKSVFLTKALDEIIKAYFEPLLNKSREGFDNSQRRLIDFSKLVKIYTSLPLSGSGFIDPRTDGVAPVNMPTDALMIINEFATVTRNKSSLTLLVIPIAFDLYTRLMSKPFKRPLKWLAWRLQTMGSTSSLADIIAGNTDKITNYKARYVKRPNPIIIHALEGVTIGGYAGCDDSGKLVTSGATEGSECELDPILHEEILQRAVELAKAAYIGDLNSSLTLGQVSETNMGIVSSQSR